MKRHLFQLLAGVTVILSTVVFLSSGNNKTLSDLALANIEAIASGEPAKKSNIIPDISSFGLHTAV